MGSKQEITNIEDLKLWAQNHVTRLNAALEVDLSAPCMAAIKVRSVTYNRFLGRTSGYESGTCTNAGAA